MQYWLSTTHCCSHVRVAVEAQFAPAGVNVPAVHVPRPPGVPVTAEYPGGHTTVALLVP